MFKILAVVCTMSGNCFPFITEDLAAYPTLAVCDQHAQELAYNLHDSIKNFPQFDMIKVGCVDMNFKLQ